ncbi:unnamed protein product [Hydatigera taeniaeformis]|uniref:AAA ATPase AAA+ lid domain-containing protein n=1 Tax=Hydatigena taeniaeformis TaxID=6205 RepID=A0A3P7EJT4_HYDTA|nr:unnamed protein product [Hydatigera taeniaeformis]
MRRAGRFDVTIHVPPPDAEARRAILQLELSKRSTSKRALEPHWLEVFAKEKLEGYTGAEVVAVVQMAAELTRESQEAEIDRQHLLSACERVPPCTLEQCQVHLQHGVPPSPLSLLPSPPPSPADSLWPSPRQYFVISSVLIVLFALVWQLIMHFDVDTFHWLHLPQ